MRKSVASAAQTGIQGNPDLAGIRDADALAKLPDDEREALAELWTEVAALRKHAEMPLYREARPQPEGLKRRPGEDAAFCPF